MLRKSSEKIITIIKTKHVNYRASSNELVWLVHSGLRIKSGGSAPKLLNVKNQEKLNYWGTKTPNKRSSRQDYK